MRQLIQIPSQFYFLELVSQTFQLDGCTDTEHCAAGTCENMKSHRTLRFYLFMAYHAYCSLSAAADNVFQLTRFFAVER